MQRSFSLPAHGGGLLELLIDIMYADIVLKDRCCRRAGDTLVAQYDHTLRGLVSSGGLPEGLEKAIDTYCIRHVLLRSPELVRTSRGVVDALYALAAQLRVRKDDISGTLQEAGKNIQDDLAGLTEQLSTKRYAHLVDAMGEAVVGYMAVAAAQTTTMENAQFAPNTPWTGVQAQTRAYMQCVRNFVTAAAAHRISLGKQREQDVEATVGALLFPDGVSPNHLRPSPPPTPVRFSKEMQAAMVTPSYVPPPSRVQHPRTATPPRQLQYCPDPIEEAFGALQNATPIRQRPALDNSVTSLLVDPSTDEPSPVTRGRILRCSRDRSGMTSLAETSATAVAHVEAEGEWVSQKGVEARSYYLCQQGDRYEPQLARLFLE